MIMTFWYYDTLKSLSCHIMEVVITLETCFILGTCYHLENK